MLSNYQIKFADFCNILTGNFKKLILDFLDEEKFVLHYVNLQIYLRQGLKLKKNTPCITVQLITLAKTICWIQHTKK